MIVAIYEIGSGIIKRRVTTVPDHVALQIHEGEDYYLNCPEDATHIIDNEPVSVTAQPTAAELIAAIVSAIQRHLDTTAQAHGYDSIISLSSYVGSSNAKWNAEGVAGKAWRDACWIACTQAQADIQAGTKAMPTPEEAISELPVMVWPESQ